MATSVSAAELPSWDFSKDAGGWASGGVWNYDGAPTISYDEKIGDGSIKLDVDFHKKIKESWSEVKLHNSASDSSPLVLDGCDMLTFDFYFNPNNMTNGPFKAKIYMKSDANVEVVNVCPDINVLAASPVEGTNLKKVKVSVPFQAVTANVVYFDFSVVSSYTNYKGEIYVDNIALGKRG
ncbi:Carbohydrate binding module 27 [Pelosinus fermentans JBW45]|uniref:Carbohydrate binding module 27 n=2 Tax=Pelosinus TaxID=365348 RepID=I9DBW8_9FIRM|nr:Carbohydrate binding module 27 [Pelosinus fermentans JBW45]